MSKMLWEASENNLRRKLPLGLLLIFVFFTSFSTASYNKEEAKIVDPNIINKCGDAEISQLMSNSKEIGEVISTYSDSSKRLSITFSLLLALATFSYGLMTFTKMANLINKFPGPLNFPFIGSVYIIAVTPLGLTKRFNECVNKFGRCFRFWVFHKPYLVVTEAHVAEKILSSPIHIHKSKDYNMFKWFLGNGLISAEVGDWKEDRKLLNPSFKYDRFDGFLSTFNKHGRILKDILNHKFAEDFDEQNLHSTFCMCTMDSISEVALGQNLSFQHDPNVKFVEKLQIALESFRKRIMEPWLVLPIIWDIFGLGRQEPGCIKYFMDTFGNIIKERKAHLLSKDDDSKAKPMIDAMLGRRSDEHIIFHVITLFAAGFETTASTINYTLYLLAVNPDIQVKVHEELDGMFAKNSDRNVTFDDQTKMKYLEMIIKESLRLFPPAPIYSRGLQSDVKLDTGIVIPEGAQVMFLIPELHRDPRVFPDPENFVPERFLPEACASRSQYAFLPFSIGPRGCLGHKFAMSQLKVLLCHILREFSVSSSKPREELQVIYGMVLEPHGGLPLQLRKRF